MMGKNFESGGRPGNLVTTRRWTENRGKGDTGYFQQGKQKIRLENGGVNDPGDVGTSM